MRGFGVCCVLGVQTDCAKWEWRKSYSRRQPMGVFSRDWTSDRLICFRMLVARVGGVSGMTQCSSRVCQPDGRFGEEWNPFVPAIYARYVAGNQEDE